MIEVKALKKVYKVSEKNKPHVVAVNDVSFFAKDGEITGLLGANGAGKSTCLRMISGLVSADEGEIKLDGNRITSKSMSQQQHIGYMPHNSGLYPRLTAIENIEYFAKLSGVQASERNQRIQELVDLLEMHSFCDRKTEGFSQGQKTKVALARAIVHRPQNLILDEPTNGLDVLAIRGLRTILRNLRDKGHCILISSHIMQEITLLCDHIAIISDGEIVIEDSVQGILSATKTSDFEDAFVAAITSSNQVLQRECREAP